MSVKRRLVALGHPGPERFQQEEETQYRGLVVWLEDQKIRHLAIGNNQTRSQQTRDAELLTDIFVSICLDMI